MTHYFNIANEGHLGGIEVDGATTTVLSELAYGSADRCQQACATPADRSALPAEFVEYVLDPSDSAGRHLISKSRLFLTSLSLPKERVLTSWDPSVDGINELDTYVFDTSDPSMKGYMLGFLQPTMLALTQKR